MAINPVSGGGSQTNQVRQPPPAEQDDIQRTAERNRMENDRERTREKQESRDKPPPPREEGKGRMVDVSA